MADKDITIGFKMTGTQESAKAIGQVDSAMGHLADTSQKDIVRSFEQVQDKARVSEFAFYDLNAEMNRTGKASETFTAGSTQVGKSSRNSSQSLLLFSQGFEDAQYGIRGVLNNIPGLVIALGGSAGLAGAISIAAVGLTQLGGLFTKIEEKASEVEDRIKAVGEALAASETDRFELVADSLDHAKESAEALKQEFDLTRQAENSFATEALSNAEKIRIAQNAIAELLGYQRDLILEIRQESEAQEAQRVLRATQEIASQQALLRKAQEKVALEEAERASAEARIADETARLTVLREQLAVLREQKEAAEKLTKERKQAVQTALLEGDPFTGAAAAEGVDRQKANAANKVANSEAFKRNLVVTQDRVDALEELLRVISDSNKGILARADVELAAARVKLEDQSQAVGIKIEEITQTLQADNLVAKSEALLETGKQFAAEIDNSLKQVEVSNEQGKAAQAALTSATSDGIITANEVSKTAQNMQVLIGQIQTGNAAFNGNISDLLNLQRSFLLEQAKSSAEIQRIKQQVGQLFQRIR